MGPNGPGANITKEQAGGGPGSGSARGRAAVGPGEVSIMVMTPERVTTRDSAPAVQRRVAPSEAGQTRPQPTAEQVPSVWAPWMATGLGFLGGALMLVASGLLVFRFGSELGRNGALALLAGVAVVLAAAGLWVRTWRSVEQLGATWWLLSSVAVLYFVDILAADVFHWSLRATLMTGGVSLVVIGGVEWLLRRRPLQLVVLFAGLAMTVGAGLWMLDQHDWVYGLAFWGVAVIVVTLAWLRVLTPVRTAYALGCIAAIAGAETIAFDHTWGVYLALGTALALLAIGVALQQMVLLAFGTVGIFLTLPDWIILHGGDSSVGSWIAFGLGVALVAIVSVVFRVRRASTMPSTETPGQISESRAA